MYDIILRNGLIADGSGAPLFKGDIGIKRDHITRIGDLSNAKAEKVLDCKELIVSPGFIDIHNHSDVSIMTVPTADNYIMQGVTTILVGNCGASAVPISDMNRELILKEWEPYSKKVSFKWKNFGDYLKALEEVKPLINVAALVGHGTVREAVLGMEWREPTGKEMDQMKRYVKEAMEAGFFGLSTGLIYAPGVFTKTDEIVELAKEVAKHGGIYSSHIRNECELLLEGITEAVTIGKLGGIRVQISHIKAFGPRNWGLLKKAFSLIESERSKGVEVTCDVYPYTAGMTHLFSALPPWAREGGLEKAVSLIENEANKSKIVDELQKPSSKWQNLLYETGLDKTLLSCSENYKPFEGKSIAKIAEELGKDPYELIFEIIKREGYSAMIILNCMSEEDVQYALKHPLSMVSTDGYVVSKEGKPHPRFYGTYPRVISEYVKNKRLLSLEEAIRKMTSLPAWKLGIWDRGLIRPGMKADLTVFDYRRIKDTATYEDPHKYPKGINYVIINGELAVEEGKLTKAKAGRVLRRSYVLNG